MAGIDELSGICAFASGWLGGVGGRVAGIDELSGSCGFTSGGWLLPHVATEAEGGLLPQQRFTNLVRY